MNQPEEDFKVGRHYPVHITHIKDPHNFYVRLIKFDDLIKELEKPGDPIEAIEKQMKVVYISPTLSKYVRGVITAIEDDTQCEVYTVDYGYTDVHVHISNITMHNNSDSIDALAVHCELHLCAPAERNGFSQKAIDAMKYYIGNEVSKMTVMYKTTAKLSVELRNSCPDDIALLLAKTEFTCLGMSNTTVSKVIKPSVPHRITFKFVETKAGEVYHVRVQNGTDVSAFYVAEVNRYKEIMAEQRDFADYCRYCKTPPVLYIGDAVGVRCQYGWNRGSVKQIIDPGNKVLVQLIDSGKEEMVYHHNIVIVAKESYTIEPALAMFCSAPECQVWDTGLHKFLYPGYEFIIKIIEAGSHFDKPHIVELINLEK